MSRFRSAGGDWKLLRAVTAGMSGAEVDFHWTEPGGSSAPYWDRMAIVSEYAALSLRIAQEIGVQWLILRHGSSTSGPFRETARSRIRALMRSADATPLIVRKDCIQHHSVFVARIRTSAGTKPVCPCGSADAKVVEPGELGRFRCRSCKSDFGWFTARRGELEALRAGSAEA